MTHNEAWMIASDLLAREGRHLDRQEWDAWLELYAEDVVYWLPGWKSEDQLVSDTRREVSLIYHTSSVGLRERISRIRSRKSVTAMPIPRTAHMVSNVLVNVSDAQNISGTASWTVNEYDPRTARSHQLFGLYEFDLRCEGGTWKFARKKLILMNDRIPTVVDFYNL